MQLHSAQGCAVAPEHAQGDAQQPHALGEAKHGEHSNPRAHEAIVSPALWRKAQGSLATHPARRAPARWWWRCSGCGRTMRGSTLGRYMKSGRRYVYTCQNRGCQLRTTIFVDRLDEAVVDQFFARLETFHLVSVDNGDLEAARKNVATLTAELDTIARIVPKHPTAVAAHQEALNEAEQKLTSAEDHLLALHSGLEGQPDVHQLRSDWPTMTLAEKRELPRAGH